MKLEQQVVSLELAKELKELGYPQESLFYWYLTNPSSTKEWILTRGRFPSSEYFCSAFIVSELGEMLPAHDGEAYYITQKGLFGNSWFCTRCRLTDMKDLHQEEAKTEADARAKMLIYLLKNKLITI